VISRGSGTGGKPQTTRVQKTGLALLHAGEWVVPGPNSEATAEIIRQDDRTVVNYYFAVEIEVRGPPENAAARNGADSALAALAQSIDNIA
jgi:hypothetical protein